MQPRCRQVPPTLSFSISATRLAQLGRPQRAGVAAAAAAEDDDVVRVAAISHRNAPCRIVVTGRACPASARALPCQPSCHFAVRAGLLHRRPVRGRRRQPLRGRRRSASVRRACGRRRRCRPWACSRAARPCGTPGRRCRCAPTRTPVGDELAQEHARLQHAAGQRSPADVGDVGDRRSPCPCAAPPAAASARRPRRPASPAVDDPVAQRRRCPSRRRSACPARRPGAPVSVATSRSGSRGRPRRRGRCASARTSRPSASVLSTSTGLAAVHGDHVAGPVRACRTACSRPSATVADRPSTGGLSAAMREHARRRPRPRRPCRTSSRTCPAAGLMRHAAGVEGDALADQRDRLVAASPAV